MNFIMPLLPGLHDSSFYKGYAWAESHSREAEAQLLSRDASQDESKHETHPPKAT